MDYRRNTSGDCRIFVILLGCAIACTLASCSYYSFSGSMAPHIKTIAIPLFDDKTAEFGIKEQLTDALVEEFTRDNTLKIADRRTADSVLEGVIQRVVDRAGAYDNQETVQEIKVYITVEIRYVDQKKNQEIWKDRITQWGAFDPAGGSTEARQEGIDEAISKIASEILTRTVSGW